MKNKKNSLLILTYILSFTIPVLTVLFSFINGELAPFGSRNVLSAGGFDSFIPYFYELYDRVHDGQSLVYSNTYGNGCDFTSLITYYLSDPTNFIILIFPRNCILTVLNFLYMFKIGLAGFSMSYYLSHTFTNSFNVSEEFYNNGSDKKDVVIGGRNEYKNKILKAIFSINWIIVAFSVAYAISTPLVTTGLNITYLSSIALFPIIVYGIDCILKDGKCFLFTIIFSVSIICNMYISIISFIFLLIYFITRDYKSIQHFIDSLFKFISSLIISLFLSGIVIVNNINSVFIKKEISLDFPFSLIDNPLDKFKQFLTRSTLSVFSLYNSNLDISFGIIFLLLIILSLFNKKESIKNRIIDIAILIFIFGGTVFSTINYLLNGFNFKYNNCHLYLFIFVFYSIYVSYKTIISFDSINTKSASISSGLLLAGILAIMIFLPLYDTREEIFISIEFLFFYFLLILIFANKSINIKLYVFLLAIIVLFEIIPNSYINLCKQGKSYFSKSVDNITSYKVYETIRNIKKDNDEARVEYIDILNHNSTPITNSFNGYDYILVNEGAGNIDCNLEYIDTYYTRENKSGIDIYKNPDAIHSAVLPYNISSYSYNEDYPFLSANILSTEYLDGKDLFSSSEMSVTAYTSGDKSEVKFSVTSANPGDVYAKMYSISHIGEVNTKKEIDVNQLSPTYYTKSVNYIYQIGLFEYNNYKDIVNSLHNSDSIIKFNEKNTVDAYNDSYLITGYPIIKSLNYYVNGKRIKPINFFEDNSIIPLVEGKNEIIIKYSPKYLICGLFMMFLGILLVYIRKKGAKLRRMKEALSDHMKNNKVYYASISIFIFTLTLCFMIAGCLPFGKASTVAGDGLIIEYADYVARVRSIKAGDLFPYFTFNIGGFKDVFRTYCLKFIVYPWLIIKYKFLPESLYLYDFNFEYFLYSLLSVITIIFYLTHRAFNRFNKNDSRLIPIAIAYSLSSYALEYYSYKAGFILLPFAPLIILGLEHLIYKKKYALYICSLSIVMFFDPYHAFLFCEFIALYFFIMRFDGVKDFISKGIRFALGSIISACINAASLVPFLMFSKDSPYLSSGQTPSIFNFYDSYLKLVSDIRIGYSIYVVSTENSKAATYAGLLITICTIPLYILCNKISVKQKIKNIVLILVLFFAFNNEMLNFIFHGFHFQTLVPNRFAICFVFIIICMFADVVLLFENHIKNIISIVLSFAVLIVIYFTRDINVDYSIIISTVFAGFYIIGSIVLYLKKKNILNNIIYILILEVIVNSFMVFPKNNGYYGTTNLADSFNSISDNVSGMKEFYNITEYLGEQGNAKNIGDMSDINTLTYFSNIYTMDMIDRLVYYNVGFAQNNSRYLSGNPLADMMMHVKYHIEDIYDNEAYSIYDKIYSYNNFIVYENKYYLPLGFVVNKDINIDKVYDGAIPYQNYITKELCGEELYSIIEIDKSKESKNYYTIGDTYENNNRLSDTSSYSELIINLDDSYSGKVYADVGGTLYFIGKVDSDNHEVYVDIPSDMIKNDYSPRIAILNEDVLPKLYDVLSESMFYNQEQDSHKITADIDVKNPGTLYLSFAYSEGWNVYIDGKVVKKEKFMGGIGVPITQGKHSVVMKYHSPGSILGSIISIVTLISLLILQFFIYRRKFNNINEEFEE